MVDLFLLPHVILWNVCWFLFCKCLTKKWNFLNSDFCFVIFKHVVFYLNDQFKNKINWNISFNDINLKLLFYISRWNFKFILLKEEKKSLTKIESDMVKVHIYIYKKKKKIIFLQNVCKIRREKKKTLGLYGEEETANLSGPSVILVFRPFPYWPTGKFYPMFTYYVIQLIKIYF